MTLTQYEAACIPMAGNVRGQAAGPALALRLALANGDVFATALTRISAEPWHATDLLISGQTSNFTSLSGP